MVMNILRSKKVAKWVLVTILILIIPAFVLWGVGSIGKGPSVLGTIGGQKVFPEDFLKSMKATRVQILLSHYGDFENMNKILKNKAIMNELAWERLILLEAAKDKRYKINNRDVLMFIATTPLFQKNGVFDKNFYEYILRNNLSMEPREFEELVRENLIVQALRNDILSKLSVSDDEALEYYNLMNDKMDFSYLLVSKDDFAEEVRTSEQQAREYYDSNTRFFLSPEKYDLELVTISFEDGASKETMESRLKDIYAKISQSPESMKAIALTEKIEYQDPAPLSSNEMIPGINYTPSIQQASAALSEGEISTPLGSGSGRNEFYMIRKKKVVPPSPIPFSEVKDAIIEALTDRKQMELAREQAEKIETSLSSGDVSLEKSAEELNREVRSTGTVTYSDYIEGLGPAKQIVELAQETRDGRSLLGVVPVKNGFIVARIDRKVPAGMDEFNKTKEEIKASLLLSKQMKAMDEWLREKAPRTKLNNNIGSL